ncbi:cytochrome c oxidase assembly factor Coa1 family protein [Aureisphaera galaxeae]|uniref:cytochrome c oxidase assembly factor Coa1 family protein n=1 Tax=Aureisphaera galaxeae TaxID=1538023 RepID=UPI0023500719|nr:cytochrome c oxidase assembly factor Coa1 family protein [Aureisphaera galaxeae]MDC8002694.1 cytochrome c oxidase assembly factor Coa1 family protein [Aureisphaera galaxeae]
MEETTRRKSWFGRNWPWVVPVGGCLVAIVLFIAFFGALFFGVTSMMSDSQAYKDALDAASTHPQVIELLGEPLESHGMMSGNISYSNGGGEADIDIPIRGPKGEAVISVEGEGRGDNWTYDKMKVYIDEADMVIDLLESRELLD